MDSRALLDDTDAVSPVIGVILMVAITVILAAVIGTFVLGLGDQVQTTAPNVQVDDSQPDTTVDMADADSDEFEIAEFELTGGESVEADELRLSHSINGTDGLDVDTSDDGEYSVEGLDGGDSLSAGNSITLTVGHDKSADSTIDLDGEEIDLIWESGEQSQELRTLELESVDIVNSS